MSIVIRMLYNNQGWNGKCKYPFEDPLCWKCQEARQDLVQGKPLKLYITPPNFGDKECSGGCWEQALLCNNNFDWGSDQHFRGVFPGIKVYLVFEQKNDKSNRIEYRLWGSTTIKSVNKPPKRKLEHDTEKYKYWIYMEPFEPLPKEKWSKVLSDKDLIGSKWGQGFYRYIREEGREIFLEKLALGVPFEDAVSKLNVAQSTGEIIKHGLLAPNIEQTVREIAMSQGRTINDIIKQAVFEWLQKQK